MMKWTYTKNNHNYQLRPLMDTDKFQYYEDGFNHMEKETNVLTQSNDTYSKEVVIDYVERCVNNPNRWDFIVVDEDGRIIGEIVINDYNTIKQSANLRIAIFKKRDYELGIGSFMMKSILDFIFKQTPIIQLTLGVYDFNLRAIHVYQKFGFNKTHQEQHEITMVLNKKDYLINESPI